MTTTNLQEILNNNIKNIETTLVEKSKKIFNTKTLELRKKTDLIKFETKKEKLEIKKQKLEEELEKLDDDIFGIERQIKEFQKIIYEKDIEKGLYEKLKQIKGYHGTSITEIDLEAIKILQNTPEILNLSYFEEIKEDTQNIFNLAVDDKERRNIILTFQNKNWGGLGIKLPTKSLYKDFEVLNGNIILKSLESPLKSN